MNRPQRLLFIAHGIVTLAAAGVLAVVPAVIPATVGITLEVQSYLLSYFLAAAELAIALLSLGAVRLTDGAAVRLIVGVFVVFHLTTAALELVYLMLTGPTPVLIANVVVRVVVSALFVLTEKNRGSDAAATWAHPRG